MVIICKYFDIISECCILLRFQLFEINSTTFVSITTNRLILLSKSGCYCQENVFESDVKRLFVKNHGNSSLDFSHIISVFVTGILAGFSDCTYA